MTREEAIRELKQFSGTTQLKLSANFWTALNMAIKALEQQKPMENFESVKDHILKLASDYKCWDNRLTHDEALELCHILEQEPCEDAVSRQSMLDAITEIDDNTNMDIYTNEVRELIGALPSVTPTRKKGKWIEDYIPLPLSDGSKKCYQCSECRTHWDNVFNCCPNCGAEMEIEE